jgi:hypothetical protein
LPEVKVIQMIRTLHAPARRLGIALAAALAMAVPAAFAQGEPAMTKRATELRETAGDSARSLVALPAQSAVLRLGDRKGPWVQVRTEAGQTGWLHLFDIAPASGAASSQASGGNAASDALRSVGGLFSRNTPTATSASGVRGLGAEDIANAQPNPAAVSQMEAMRLDEAQARDFAGAAALSPVAVDPLPAPARAATAGRPGGAPGTPESQ